MGGQKNILVLSTGESQPKYWVKVLVHFSSYQNFKQ